MRPGLNTKSTVWFVTVVLASAVAVAQAPATPHAAGTVKAVTASSITVTTATQQDYTVAVPSSAKILEVAPGSKDLKSATPGQMSDISVGDKVIVNGSVGDTGTTLTAQRIVLMKSAAIAQSHAAEEAAWARGSGGIVRSVNADTGTLAISSGMKTVTVQTTASTVVRRYAGGSVRFEDAVASPLGAIQPGDQLRVRGTRPADGTSIQADEIVTGSFRNYSGVVESIDGGAGTLTLKDLTTKKTVSVAVTPNTDVRRIPPQAATMVAMRMKGGAGAATAVAPGAGDEARQRAGRAGTDLSQMLSRLPTETLGGLKVGEAVMIVATAPAQIGIAAAITLLAGVEPILAASPAGEATTLSPWSVGSADPDAGGITQ